MEDSELRELIEEDVQAVDDRDLELHEKILELSLRLLELLKIDDDRLRQAIDLLTEVGVDTSSDEYVRAGILPLRIPDGDLERLHEIVQGAQGEYPPPTVDCTHGADGSWNPSCPVCVSQEEVDG